MTRHIVTLISCLAFISSLVAQDATPKKEEAADLAGYLTLDQATTAKIISAGSSQPGYLGIAVVANDAGKLVVTDVKPGSPGEQAGVKTGDLVLQLGGRPVGGVDLFRETIHARGAGESITVGLQRDGKPLEVTARLGSISRPMKLGVERASLGASIAEVREGEGAPIERIAPDSPAAKAGLKAGDVLVKINGEQLNRATELADSIAERKPGDTLTLTYKRDGAENEVKVQLATDAGRGGAGGGFGFGGTRGAAAFTVPLWKKDLFRLAVIPIEFTDVKHSDKIPKTEWDEALLSTGAYKDKKNATDQPVFGSLNDYFKEQSAGKLRFEGKVFDWVEVGKKRMDYSQGSGTSNRSAVLTEAMEKLLARDGKEALNDFDGLFFIYAGDRVNTNRGAVYFPHSSMLVHQNKRWLYVFAPEGGSRMTTLATYVREVGQMLGLPSLAARTENAGSEGCGAWCVMSAVMGDRPQHLNAWCKEQLGWIQPTVIDPSVKQKLVLAPIEGTGKECVKILVRPDGSEYFLLENRRKKDFDANLPGEGLLIWRIVDNRPILEESHGIEGPAGPQAQLAHVPYPSPANNAFTPDTTPSSESPKGGGMTVRITNIRRLVDGRISFCVGHDYR